MKILMPDTIAEDPETSHQIVRYSVRGTIPPEHQDAQVLVVWGNSPAKLAELATQLPNLKLVQSAMAGTEMVLAAGFAPEVTICSGAGLHNGPVVEHTLALTLALVRKIPTLVQNKQAGRWTREIGGIKELYTKPVSTLRDAKVLIWGFGSIGADLARPLVALGAQVRGIARSARVQDGINVFDESQLDDSLAQSDILIMVLPETPQTIRAMNAHRLSQLPEHAFLVNVGRGKTVDEEALIEALVSRKLAGAALDVMWQEPLPEESPLWKTPNLLISPHAAGGRPVGAAQFIASQVEAFVNGGELRNVVSR